MKRFLTLLLALAMLLSLLTGFAGAAEEKDLWAQILAYEAKHLRKTRSLGGELTAADYAALSGDIAELVMASEDYTEGTCTYDGTNAMFFWENADGEPQGYSPSLNARLENGATGVDLATVGEIETASYAARGGTTTGKDVYVIGPWYGSDNSFTNQYKTEGQRIAKATGGTCTVYSGTKATIGSVAKAMENGAVVIFDSHGVTDYDQKLSYTYPDEDTEYVYDSVTGAHTSYLTLTTGTGLTAADKARVTASDGKSYYHAYYSKGAYCVDGTVIANHMTKNAPNSMLWMPICLGMATEGLCTPLRAKGVETVYGYSESVTFSGDYEYEEPFWSSMLAGKTVAEAAAEMKKQHGSWDPGYFKAGTYYNTEAKAQYYFVAFPVVVSSEDAHPGQRSVRSGGTPKQYGADTVQTVKSTWKLKAAACEHTYAYAVTTAPTVSASGVLTGTCSKCSEKTTVTLPKLDAENYTYTVTSAATCAVEGSASYTWKNTDYGTLTFPVILPKTTTHSYQDVVTPPTCAAEGYTTHTCTVCGVSYTDSTTPKTDAHTFGAWTVTAATCEASGARTRACTVCGETETEWLPALAPCPSTAFADVDKAAWYHQPVDFMVFNGLMNGESSTAFAPNKHLTRAMLATILYRVSGDTAARSHPFTDVPDGRWYSEAVAWAYETGVVTGTSTTTFSPETNVTREQAAAMLYRFAGQPAAAGDVSIFNDANRISGYAVTPLRWAVGEGILNGKSAQLLDPTGTATRAEIAKILTVWLMKR